MNLPIRDIISTIEEYRKAYVAHHSPKFYKDNKYNPLVIQDHITSVKSGSIFTVSLFDTWINTTHPGRFLLGKEFVTNSKFSSKTSLQLALEELLNFTRVPFMNDTIFNKI